jgi:hypothetical protein
MVQASSVLADGVEAFSLIRKPFLAQASLGVSRLSTDMFLICKFLVCGSGSTQHSYPSILCRSMHGNARAGSIGEWPDQTCRPRDSELVSVIRKLSPRRSWEVPGMPISEEMGLHWYDALFTLLQPGCALQDVMVDAATHHILRLTA